MLRRRLLKEESGKGEQVDLGLPSGTIWARGNIMPDGNGGYKIGEETDWQTPYFTWGNVNVVFPTTYDVVDGAGYIGVFENNYDFSKSIYQQTPGYSLTGNIPLNKNYDAAIKYLGSPWHIPTKNNFQELIDNTDLEAVEIDGILGQKFMQKMMLFH